MRLTAVDRPGAQTTYNSHSEREYNPMDTEVQNEVAIDLETPYRWGKEDALEGVDRANGLSYYAPGTMALAAYNDGYDDGLVIWAILCGEAGSE